MGEKVEFYKPTYENVMRQESNMRTSHFERDVLPTELSRNDNLKYNPHKALVFNIWVTFLHVG